MEFKVKRSFLNIFIINLVLIFLVCVSIPFAYNTWVFIVVFAICFGLFCFYNTSVIFATCKVENNKILYRTGAFKYEIDIKSIEKIEKNRSYNPSLATSFDRIRIVTKNKKNKQEVFYISVVDRDKLIEIVKNSKENRTSEEKPTKEKTTKKAQTKKTTAKKTTKK